MGLFKSLGKFFTGSRPKTQMQQINRFSPGQLAALSKLLSQGMADTDPAALEKRYRHLFERDTVPDIAEKFTSMGGGQRSSGFEESLRRGGLDLSEQLAGMRYQGGMQKLGLGLQPQFDTVMTQTPGSGGLLGGLMGPLTGMLGMKLGQGLGLGGRRGGMGYAPPRQAPYTPPRGAYMPGQPRGMQRGVSPVLLKILEGIQF